jgi:hypothetical protein
MAQHASRPPCARGDVPAAHFAAVVAPNPQSHGKAPDSCARLHRYWPLGWHATRPVRTIPQRDKARERSVGRAVKRADRLAMERKTANDAVVKSPFSLHKIRSAGRRVPR